MHIGIPKVTLASNPVLSAGMLSVDHKETNIYIKKKVCAN